MATRILPALNDLEREWAVFKSHGLVPPGACNINLFRIEGGANTFILPDRCIAYFTVTYLPDERKEDVVAQVEQRIRAAAALDPWLEKHPPKVDWDPPEYPIEFPPSDIEVEAEPVRLLCEAIEAATGEEAVMGGRGGITDAGWFSRARVPSVVFGPGDVNFAHAVDERVHLDEVVNHCKATVLFLLRYCGLAS
jgi:formylaminopyrimidine deformylase